MVGRKPDRAGKDVREPVSNWRRTVARGDGGLQLDQPATQDAHGALFQVSVFFILDLCYLNIKYSIAPIPRT